MDKFTRKVKKLATTPRNKGSPKMTEDLLLVQGLLVLIMDVQSRHNSKN